jgi:hypothetical protein
MKPLLSNGTNTANYLYDIWRWLAAGYELPEQIQRLLGWSVNASMQMAGRNRGCPD